MATNADQARSDAVVRTRAIGRGLVERIRLENHGLEPLEATVSVEMHADFADLFEVKEQRAVASRIHRLEALESTLRVVGEREGRDRSSTFRTSPPAELELRGSSGLASWTVRLAPQDVPDVVRSLTAAIVSDGDVAAAAG